MVETETKGNKNITISISIDKYIKLKKIANDGNFSVAKLVKDGIDLLLMRWIVPTSEATAIFQDKLKNKSIKS